MKIDYSEILTDDDIFEAFNKASYNIRNETLSCIFFAIKSALEKQGAYSKKIHGKIFLSLCESVGGQVIYLPRADKALNIIRDVSIFKEFNGNNINELSIKYGVSVRTINNILSDQRKTRKLARDCIERLGVNRA